MPFFALILLILSSASIQASGSFSEFLNSCSNTLVLCGSGSFGRVYKTTHKTRGRIALKSINCGDDEDEFRAARREARLMRDHPHKNLLRYVDAFFMEDEWNHILADESAQEQGISVSEANILATPVLYACICSEQMDADLHRVIRLNKLSIEHRRYIIRQILSAVEFLHENLILHRDIKPQNILVNENCVAKLADLGAAHEITAEERHAQKVIEREEVVTRWYRSPELLMHDEHYLKSDVWSLGCVLGEMLTRSPLFPGDEGCQLATIRHVMKSPPETTLGEIPEHDQGRQNERDLLLNMLIPDPQKRLSSAQALNHKYFASASPTIRSEPQSRQAPQKDSDSKASTNDGMPQNHQAMVDDDQKIAIPPAPSEQKRHGIGPPPSKRFKARPGSNTPNI